MTPWQRLLASQQPRPVLTPAEQETERQRLEQVADETRERRRLARIAKLRAEEALQAAAGPARKRRRHRTAAARRQIWTYLPVGASDTPTAGDVEATTPTPP